MRQREETVAMEFVRIADMLGTNFARDNVKPDRITISFPSIAELYRFTKALRYGIRDMYRSPLNEPGDWLRDGQGCIYADWTLYGLDFRFTTPVRTTGYPITYAEIEPFDPNSITPDDKVEILTTVTINPDTHMVVRR